MNLMMIRNENELMMMIRTKKRKDGEKGTGREKKEET